MRWFKMHVDSALHDPSIGLLPLDTQAVFFKLYALAAFQEHGGYIEGPLEAIAWTMRLPVDVLQRHLDVLAKAGVILVEEGGVRIGRFAEEQKRVDREQARQRKQRQRAREARDRVAQEEQAEDEPREKEAQSNEPASRNGHDGVTDASRNGHAKVTPIEEEVEEEEEEELINAAAAAGAAAANAPPEGSPSVFAVWEQNMGPLTPLVAEGLEALEREHGPDWVARAIREAVVSGGKTLRYVQAILDRWKREGYGTRPKRRRGRRRPRDEPEAVVVDEATRAEEEATLRALLGDEPEAEGET